MNNNALLLKQFLLSLGGTRVDWYYTLHRTMTPMCVRMEK